MIDVCAVAIVLLDAHGVPSAVERFPCCGNRHRVHAAPAISWVR